MSYCINPSCSDPAKNNKNAQDCMACGASLRLKNRYRAQKLLGQGGFGKTFKAIDEDRPGQPLCVIKQFAYSSDNPKHQQMALKLFYEEAKHLQSLGSHPQIPELLAYFDVDGQPYLVQQYIDGQDLEQELAAEGAFSQQQIRELLESLLPVLDFLHNQFRPVIHRDIKPANIIRRRQDQTLILVDFGAAKQATQTMLAKTGTTIGSPEFAAPEQTRGKPAFASDIYSLGVTCIHLLTAISPFDLFDTSQDDWVWRDYLLNNRVDGLLGKVLDKSIVNAVGRRYQSAAEMLAALDNRAQPAAAKLQPSYVPPTINAAYNKDQREKFSFETVYLIKGSRQVTETKKVLKPNWWGVGSKEVEESHTKKVNDWQIITKSGQADRLIEDLGNKIQLEMVKIPGGEFLMGAPSSEHTSRENERPQHLVKVPRFYLGKYPITQEQYVVIMGNNPSQCKGDRLPVENVDWNDAQLFCQRLTAYTQKNYRLPTEAEWEYACRGRTTTPFCFGETISTKLANYNGKLTYGSGIQGEYRSKSTPVGDFPPNGFGLCDMHGNVWEWCADSWHDNYSGAPIDGSAWTGSTSRVLRGGSWFVNPSACRSAYRSRANPGDADAYIGFRVAYMP